MALQVVRVPDPPAGTDWSYAIPGIYLEDVIGVSATLATATTFSGVMHDSSGNGNDGGYELFGSPSPLGPGFLTGANAATWTFFTGPGPSRYGSIFSGIDCGAAFSFDVWAKVNPAALNGTLFGLEASGVLTTCRFYVGSDGSLTFQWADSSHLYGAVAAAGTYPFDGSAHHVGMSYDGTHAKIYLDGVSRTVSESGIPALNAGSFCVMDVGGSNDVGNTGAASQYGQPAFYQSVLAAGAFAAHHAASGSLTAYAAAVFANSPTNFYELNDGTPGVGRQVVLRVTDGTHVVDDIPTGFAESASVGPYSYSWQPGLGSSVEASGGTLITVAVPELLLPPGYTIGTHTLDLGASDQWSAISIWWDRSTHDLFGAISDYVYPPGLYYVYEQIGT